MKNLQTMRPPRFLLLSALCLLLLSQTVFAQVTVAPSLMNFQGRLARPDGTPVANGTYPVRFSLWTAATGGTEAWSQTLNSVQVRNGTFAVPLNLSSGFENGATDVTLFNSDLFLEIKVGSDPALTPRQRLASVAYALKANSVPDGSIGAAQIANGSITSAKFAANTFNPLAWLLGGNSGTVGKFLGTTDNQPLELRVNNQRALQMQYVQNGDFQGINLLGGYRLNTIAPGVTAATVFGGENFGGADHPNRVTDHEGTVSGGIGNLAGSDNTTLDDARYATVGGGRFNTASGDSATVAGGNANVASNFCATVGGGFVNSATGFAATIAGGFFNIASGRYSFAAGLRAKAVHDGCFVWADSNPGVTFHSTDINQFLIRAGGGVKLSPGTTLEFGFGVEEKELHAGQIGYAAFTPDALDIVGAGTTSANHKVKIWAEGGTLFTGNVTATRFTSLSDARYKTHIVTLENSLDTLRHLRGVTFDWDRERWKERGFVEGRQIGFIAQEIEKVLPELVSTDSNGYKSVAYANVVPILVEAVKQQQKQIEELKTRLKERDAQQAQINALQRRLDAMQAQP